MDASESANVSSVASPGSEQMSIRKRKDMDASESANVSSVASPGSEQMSIRKRKVGDGDYSPMETPSTPTQRERRNGISARRNLLSVAGTTPNDFRVLSSQSTGALYKKRKLQTEAGKMYVMNVLPLSSSWKYRDVPLDSGTPVSFARKAFSLGNSPASDDFGTPINLTSNRCDLFDDGSIGKYLNARKLWKTRLQMPSPKRGSLSPMTPGRNINSRRSPSVRLQSPLGVTSNTPSPVNSSIRAGQCETRPGRSLFGSPSITPLCKKIACTMSISTPVSDTLRTPDVMKIPEGSGCRTPNSIDAAIEKPFENPDLIGDFSKGYLLPTVKGKNPDVPSISPSTMAKVLNGDYDESFMVLDCRYPYEYEGGHIKGAKNFYTKNELAKKLFPSSINLNSGSRPILIFHCEFSSERGPRMYHFVRKKDRKMNAVNYPSLFYPEMYVLEGGYCAFYSNHSELCDPKAYKTMRDEQNTRDLLHFRAECKADKNGKTPERYDDAVVAKLEFPATPST